MKTQSRPTTDNNFSNKVVNLLGSLRFFYFTLIVFILEGVWIAFSALYPQAFDENFHFGLIKLYSHYWLPFLTKQPPDANQFGAVTRDPSFLYHYLMSFPYRFIALFIHSIDLRVIIIRLIDVAFFTLGIIVFRKLLLKVGVSKSLSNFILFIFILIPIVPQLAAQVNYDDLLFLLVGWIFLQALNILDVIKKKKIDFSKLLILFISCLFTTLVKYAFAPIFFAIFVFISYYIFINFRHNFKTFKNDLLTSYLKTSLMRKVILLVLVVVAIGLFAERDGVNIVRYHSIAPNCSRVLNVKDCSAYSPWYVDYQRHQIVLQKGAYANFNIFGYTYQWFYWMWYRLFFAVNGLSSNFYSYPPLPLPSIAAIILAVTGLLAFIRWYKKLLAKPYITFLFFTCAIYLVTLFIKSYASYRYTAVFENMNGRYLIPILLPLGAIIALAFSRVLRKSLNQRVISVIIVSILFLEGGGILTFVLRSDDSWYWPNKTISKVNNEAQKIAKHTVVKLRLKK